jgi:hypothetical protein
MSLVVLVKTMSVLINFLTENTNLVSVLMIICPNLASDRSNRTDEFRELSSVIKNGNSISMICIVLFKSLSICKGCDRWLKQFDSIIQFFLISNQAVLSREAGYRQKSQAIFFPKRKRHGYNYECRYNKQPDCLLPLFLIWINFFNHPWPC